MITDSDPASNLFSYLEKDFISYLRCVFNWLGSLAFHAGGYALFYAFYKNIFLFHSELEKAPF